MASVVAFEQSRLSTPAAVAAGSATTTAASAAATKASGSGFAGLGFVDRQTTTIMLLVVEPLDGGVRLGLAAHLHEPKTLGTASFAVGDDLWRSGRCRTEKTTARDRNC